MDYIKKPIPEIPSIKGWREVPISECHEKLVLCQNTERIVLRSYYYENNVNGSIPEIYVRESVWKMLVQASELLPEGYTLGIYDGYRPFDVQQALYDEFFHRIQSENPEKTTDEIHELTQQYVSLPSVFPERPSTHLTGGSVDVWLYQHNQPCDMGTFFDDFSSKSATNYGETIQSNEEWVKNRRLLYHTMIHVGFSNYNEEFWHYDFGNQFHNKVTGKSYAIYGLAKFK